MNHKLSIPYMIVVFFFFLVFLYLGKEKIDLLLHSQLEEASIVRCESKSNQRMEANLPRNEFLSYMHIAETEAGEIAEGFPFIVSKKQCEEAIGKKVSVFVSDYIDVPSRINTFFNFWLLPYLSFYLLVVMFVAGLKGRVPVSVNLLLLIGVVLYLLEFQ
ncbi:MAG: hypothetical protein CL674_03285 [Bdellovibrionaceae bacterium]|nr:hypothetical protein [Pseudobdellovibrionaceae bacterium]